MATALISAITDRTIRNDVGMTGELTLTGRVLAIGGLKEKVLAAHRAGIRCMIAPLANKPDWADLPRTVRRDIQFDWVESMDQVIKIALKSPDSQPAVLVLQPEESADLVEAEMDDDAVTEPDGMTSDTTVVQSDTSDASKPRAAKESRRGGGRRNKKAPPGTPSVNLMPPSRITYEF
jgi:hypothetical protein